MDLALGFEPGKNYVLLVWSQVSRTCPDFFLLLPSRGFSTRSECTLILALPNDGPVNLLVNTSNKTRALAVRQDEVEKPGRSDAYAHTSCVRGELIGL